MNNRRFVQSLYALAKTSEPGAQLTDEEAELLAELAARLPWPAPTGEPVTDEAPPPPTL